MTSGSQQEYVYSLDYIFDARYVWLESEVRCENKVLHARHQTETAPVQQVSKSTRRQAGWWWAALG